MTAFSFSNKPKPFAHGHISAMNAFISVVRYSSLDCVSGTLMFVTFFNLFFVALTLVGVFLILLGGGLFWAYFYIDALLGISFAKRILYHFWGVNSMRVVVQNTYGGNNIEFLIQPNEERQLPDFSGLKLDKTYTVKSVEPTDKNSLHDIEKLGELRDKGLISTEEFFLKKKQILGL